MNAERNKLLVHLVGSVPLPDSESVFRTVSAAVGRHMKRIPDGETGDRRLWINYVRDMLSTHPDFEIDHSVPPLQLRLWNGTLHREVPLLKYRDGTPERTIFKTRYAEMARESYAVFKRLRDQVVIPKGVRFMVALPTPLAITYNYLSPTSRPKFIASFTTRILEEVAELAAHIPHDQLSIQWDILQEILMWENYYGYQPPDYKEEIVSVLQQLSDGVPAGIELGWHFCYGSPRDEHLIQPKDAGVMVEIANLVVPKVKRKIDFIHLPVPKERVDDAFYRPLKDLHAGKETEIYLGLVHYQDPEGNRIRLQKARSYIDIAGVASECGWGRSDPQRVPGQLEAHRQLVEVTAPA